MRCCQVLKVLACSHAQTPTARTTDAASSMLPSSTTTAAPAGGRFAARDIKSLIRQRVSLGTPGRVSTRSPHQDRLHAASVPVTRRAANRRWGSPTKPFLPGPSFQFLRCRSTYQRRPLGCRLTMDWQKSPNRLVDGSWNSSRKRSFTKLGRSPFFPLCLSEQAATSKPRLLATIFCVPKEMPHGCIKSVASRFVVTAKCSSDRGSVLKA